ncbi:acid protease [Daedalea quercina L-15889]|uniref:Acid protease n=1 Tax=Daedalea quercina L-15889 TaxID=1314783 RepID=A0A165TAW6_9APHY|nr:acid protease [Daedalea quercina L-15889]
MLLCSVSVLALIGCSYGLKKVPLEPRTIGARSPTAVSLNDGYSGNLGFSNVADAIWTATVYVQGRPFQASVPHTLQRDSGLSVWKVQMDSGSADLWVDTRNAALERASKTRRGGARNGAVSYAQDTDAAGPRVRGNVNVTLGAFTVDGPHALRPARASAVYGQLENTTHDGYPFLVNLFRGAPGVPPFMTFLLSRPDRGTTRGGLMSIREVAEEYAAVLDQPRLPVVSSGWWETFTDGIIANGELLSTHSNVTKSVAAEPGRNQSAVIFDTGTSLAAAPRAYVGAIHEEVPGAVFDGSLGYYTLPCDAKLNISMVFGSDTYPIDPIDDTARSVDPDGSYVCIGAFFPTPATADFILGAAFMRNVYALTSVSSHLTCHGDEPPCVQLLSTTDQDGAYASFDASIVRWVAQAWAQAHNISASEAAPQTTTYSLVPPPPKAPAPRPRLPPQPCVPGHFGCRLGVEREDIRWPFGSSSSEPRASSRSPSNHWQSELLRDSYVVLGLVAGAVLLLLGVLAKLVAGTSRGSASRHGPHVASGRPYDPDSEDTKPFVAPYDDPVRPIGSH